MDNHEIEGAGLPGIDVVAPEQTLPAAKLPERRRSSL